jgi:hypothetical protein
MVHQLQDGDRVDHRKQSQPYMRWNETIEGESGQNASRAFNEGQDYVGILHILILIYSHPEMLKSRESDIDEDVHTGAINNEACEISSHMGCQCGGTGIVKATVNYKAMEVGEKIENFCGGHASDCDFQGFHLQGCHQFRKRGYATNVRSHPHDFKTRCICIKIPLPGETIWDDSQMAIDIHCKSLKIREWASNGADLEQVCRGQHELESLPSG